MSFLVKVHNTILGMCKDVAVPKIYYDAKTRQLEQGSEADTVTMTLFECGPVSANWEDSPNMLEESPKDMTNWLWLARVGYQSFVDTQPLLEVFETPTYVDEDTDEGSPTFRLELIECDFSDPPKSGSSTGSSVDITLNIIPNRR